MKQPIEWNHEEELFSDVYQALEDAGINVHGATHEGSYGEQGYIDIRTEDGRTFRLDLTEIL